MKKLILLPFIIASLFLMSCSNESDTSEEVEEATEAMAEDIEKAVEETEETAKEAKKEVEETVEEATE